MFDRFVTKINKFIQDVQIENFIRKTRELFKGRFKYIAFGGIFLIFVLICSVCSLSAIGNRNEPQPTYSITDVAATIYAEIDQHTQIAATIYAQLSTSTPEIPQSPEPTENPFNHLYSLFPCIPQNTETIFAKVVEVVDGDTIKVEINNQVFSVRYIGIDCPECKDPNQPVQTFSLEANQKNKEMVENQEVILVKDVSEYDRYNRLLRYVLIGNTFVNYELVKQGYAHASTYPPDVACSEFFAETQNYSSLNLLGFWSPTYNQPTVDPIVIQPTNTPVNNSQTNCDPSYPTVCIPRYPPDLDCGDISFRRFQVLPPDPHNFDGNDNDGIGCESG